VPAVLAVLAVVSAVSGSGPPRAGAEPASHPLNLSLLYPISTNQDPAIHTALRLNVFYGRVGEIRGLDLSAVVGRVDGAVSGVQLTGVHSWVGGDLTGLAATGGVQYVGGDLRGVQVAGLANFDRGRFSGLQIGGLFNLTEEGLSGVQLSSLYNLTSGDGKCLQLSSAVNSTAGSLRGAQVSALLNFTTGTLTGCQAGFMGMVDSLNGAQIGVVNMARAVRGTQIGVVNLARRIDGLPVGMVNWTSDGGKEWDSFATSYAGFSTGLRTTVRRTYSVIAMGVGDIDTERGDTFFLSSHVGREIPISPRWDLDLDGGFVHVIPQPSDDPAENDRLHFALGPACRRHVGSRSALYLGGPERHLRAAEGERGLPAARVWASGALTEIVDQSHSISHAHRQPRISSSRYWLLCSARLQCRRKLTDRRDFLHPSRRPSAWPRCSRPSLKTTRRSQPAATRSAPPNRSTPGTRRSAPARRSCSRTRS
jgi:hypothetical protein